MKIYRFSPEKKLLKSHILSRIKLKPKVDIFTQVCVYANLFPKTSSKGLGCSIGFSSILRLYFSA
jgi:hypothetical protein